MAVKIRLTRMGCKKRPFYRVVAIDGADRRDGRALEIVGFYNPMVNPPEIKIDKAKVDAWMKKGAQPSDTVASLLKKAS